MDALELRKRRERAGITQKELGRLVGLTDVTVSHYESLPDRKRKTHKWKIPLMAQHALDKVLKDLEQGK